MSGVKKVNLKDNEEIKKAFETLLNFCGEKGMTSLTTTLYDDDTLYHVNFQFVLEEKINEK